MYNSTKGKRERMGRILMMHANHREEIEQVYAGDIAAVVGLKDTTTGDTLCDENHEIILESMVFPDPVIQVAIEPKTKAGQEKMTMALVKLAEEDPTFKTYTDQETGQTIIAGMGEMHLEIIVDRLLREFKVEATVGKPQVAYRETIRKKVRQGGHMSVRPAVGSTVTVLLRSSLLNPVRAIPLRIRPWAAQYRSSLLLLTPHIRRLPSPACWPATNVWTSERCLTVLTMMLTLRKWHIR